MTTSIFTAEDYAEMAVDILTSMVERGEITREEAGLPVEHRTRTYLMASAHDGREATPLNWRTGRLQQPADAVAECICGWKSYADTRQQARSRARAHREGRL